MLKSSKEYLQALRDGKYLLFLEWPKFIINKYSVGNESQDADATLDLLLFEWLNNGFCLDDVKHVALLIALYELDPTPIVNELLYAVVTIYGVIIPCMVYSTHNLQTHYLVSDELTADQVSLLMKNNLTCIEDEVYRNFAGEESDKFRKLVMEVKPSDLSKAFQEINSVTRVRNIINEYLLMLQSIDMPNDKLKPIRYSWLARLAKYVQSQAELNEEVSNEIGVYVKSIRDSQPADFEEAYLDQLAPLTFMESTDRVFTKLGLMFFNLVKPQLLSIAENPIQNDPNSNSPNSSAKLTSASSTLNLRV